MMRAARRAEDGSALVELAVLAPVLIFMLVGLIEIGRYMYFGILATHAARAGVQYAAQTNITAVDGTGTTNAAAQDAAGLPNMQVTRTIVCALDGVVTTCPSSSVASGSQDLVYYVQVQVTSTLTPILRYPGIPTNVPVTATAMMVIGSQ